MSYAAVAASNAPPVSEQPVPDPSLLEGSHNSSKPVVSASHVGDGQTINVVSSKTAEQLKEAIEHADDVEPASEHFDHARAETRAAVPPLPSPKFPPPSKNPTDDTTPDIKKGANAAGKKVGEAVEDVEKTAEKGYAKAKKAAGKVEDEVEKGYGKAKKFAGEVEAEAEKAAKKAGKKAKELERDGRDWVKKYPQAATGVVGVANLAVLIGVGLAAYQNWDLPRWDKRVVSAVTVGVLGLFAAEGALGYYEYEQDQKESL